MWITFDEHYAQVVAEAEAEGPAAVSELRMHETSYRFAGLLIARRRELRITSSYRSRARAARRSRGPPTPSAGGRYCRRRRAAYVRASWTPNESASAQPLTARARRAATGASATLTVALLRPRGLGVTTKRTSRSSAFRNRMSLSIEKPASLPANRSDTLGWVVPRIAAACDWVHLSHPYLAPRHGHRFALATPHVSPTTCSSGSAPASANASS
jgi:hypothetical protein